MLDLVPRWWDAQPDLQSSPPMHPCSVHPQSIHTTHAVCNIHYHYSDVTLVVRRLKSPETRLFVQQLVRANDKNTKLSHYWPFVQGIFPAYRTGNAKKTPNSPSPTIHKGNQSVAGGFPAYIKGPVLGSTSKVQSWQRLYSICMLLKILNLLCISFLNQANPELLGVRASPEP